MGTAYAVDVLCDGEQIADSGIITSEETARITFTHYELSATSDPDLLGRERTVRLIRNGDVLAETTITK